MFIVILCKVSFLEYFIFAIYSIIIFDDFEVKMNVMEYSFDYYWVYIID